MRIATWNVNSIRARLPRLLAWVDRCRPEVLCLQETRVGDAHLPTAELGDLGYEVAHWGIDHRNGVAICSSVGLDDVRRGFRGPVRAPYDEARLLTARCAGIEVTSVYVPNGRELDDPHYLYKLVWLERLRGDLLAAGVGHRPWVVAGDLNVAPTDLDIYAPQRWKRRTHASPPERAAVQALLDLGLTDVVRAHDPSPGLYTWWNYRPGGFEKGQGLRIDLVLTSPPVTDRVVSAWVDVDERGGERPSDHAPVVVELDGAGPRGAPGAPTRP